MTNICLKALFLGKYNCVLVVKVINKHNKVHNRGI